MSPITEESPPPTPPLPLYVLRGHSAQLSCVHFLRVNSRLLTGDAEGWVIMWKISSRRPVVVWKPHENAILGIKDWGEDRVITHGRDNKLYVWQLGPADEAGLSMVLPTETPAFAGGRSHRSPWLLHSLDTNTLNFCSFAMCYEHGDASATSTVTLQRHKSQEVNPGPILIALPSTMDSNSIDIMQFPSGKRLYSSVGMPKVMATVVSSELQTKTGMAMSISIFYHSSNSSYLMLSAGFESGHVCLFGKDTKAVDHLTSTWRLLYAHKTHSQPVLSISVLRSPIPSLDTKSIFSSSADSLIAKHPVPDPLVDATSLDTSLKQPRTVTTHHTGQQSLVVRSDGRIIATAGWDGKVRIYDTNRLRELAVLKWHKEGCHAVDFGLVGQVASQIWSRTCGGVDMQLQDGSETVGESTVNALREQRERARHWVAAGSKDGKVSLWDVY